jgi:signal transduction histidine kinase
VIGAVGWVLFALFADFLQPTPLWMRIYDTVIALLLAIPLAVRALGEVVRGVLVVGILGAATIALYFGAQAAAASLVDQRLRPLVDLGAIVAILVGLVGGPAWVRAGIDRLVFRRSRWRREELRVFLQTLTPDLGAIECCRRGLAALARVLHLRGVAMILADGSSIAHGDFPLERISPVWPRGAEADRLPAVGLADYAIRELPADVQEALLGTDVVAIVPVRSPRRVRGHLFMTTGFISAAFSDEDVATVESFATQLALLLDGAELLARAVAVERTLAHNEKLAAIGALAARIAHEIRNPVTAARSGHGAGPAGMTASPNDVLVDAG